MHFNFDFTAVQVLWTLTFAAHLVLLVVLMGRERIRRFPWFTTGIVLVTLRLLTSRLLYGRLPQLTLSGIFIILADVTAVIALLVVLEMARRAFGRVSHRVWIAWILVLAFLGAVVLAKWGVWPAWESIAFDTPLARLGMMQLVAQKLGLLADVLTIALALLVVLFGRRYGAGWRSHVQQILIGLSTASLAQLAAQTIWQVITKTAAPHSMAEYERIMGLREKLFNANSVVYLLVLIWWIVCLWIDEPATAPAAVATAQQETPAAAELPPDSED